MAYTITGGRKAGTPRTSSGGGGSGVKITGGRTVSASSSGSPRPETTAERIVRTKQGTRPSDVGRPGLTPLRFVLRAASVPGLAVGEAIRDPSTIFSRRSGIDLFRDERANLPGQALQGRGLLPGGKLGSVLKFGADVLLDPTTYVTFGGSSASRAAGRSISEQLAAHVVKEGRRLTLSERALYTARREAAKAAAPKGISIGATIPFTRGRTLWLGESTDLAAAASRIGKAVTPVKLRETIRKGASSGRGASAAVNEIRQDVRRLASIQKGETDKILRQMNIDLDKVLKKNGLNRKEASRAMSFYRATGGETPLPDFLKPLTEDGGKLLDDVLAIDRADGVAVGFTENYLPFAIARHQDRPLYDSIFGSDSANVMDNPFFVKPKTSDSFESYIDTVTKAGIAPETDFLKLIEMRLNASNTARQKAAIDNATRTVYGAKEAAAKVPDAAPAAARLAGEQARLRELTSRLDTAAPQASATAARRAEVDARAAYQASLRTGDPNAVAASRQALEEARAAAPAEVADAVRKADGNVAKAERRLKVAEGGGSKAAITQARAALVRAQSVRSQTRLALERARASHVGEPLQVVAQTKKVLKAERQLAKVERKRGAIELANEKQAARAGREVTPEEYVELRKEWVEIGGATKYHKGTLLPPNIADDLATIYKTITPTIADETAVVAVGRFMRGLTGRWKALALLSPGYYARNVMDDGLRANWAGARNPHSFYQAGKALLGLKGVVKVRGKTYTNKQIIDIMESNGVVRTGYVKTEILSSEDEARRGRGPGRGPFVRTSARANEFREDTVRAGTFIELIKRGDDFDTAAAQVRRYLFDYGETGAFVDAARKFWLPFITFTSKALPLTAREFARRPGRAATIGKAMAFSEEMAGNPDMSFLPPWSESSFAFPSTAAFRRFIGAPEDQALILNPERVTSFTSLDLLDPRPDSIQRNFAGYVTPFVKSPAESLTNYSTFKGRSYREGERVWSPKLIQLAEGLGIPIPGYGAKKDTYTGEIGKGYSPRLDTLLRMLPIFSQQAGVIPNREGGTHLKALKYATGLPLSPYDRLRGEFYAEKKK